MNNADKSALCAILMVCGLAATPIGALAAPPRVILSVIPTDPSSVVPSLGTTYQAFGKPQFSPDGSKWIINADTLLATTNDEIIVKGSGTTNAGSAVVAQEAAVCDFDATRTYGLLDEFCGINNAGNITFGGDLSGATTSDEFTARIIGGVFELIAGEGAPAWGLGGTIGFGSSSGAAHILGDNTVRLRSSSLTTATTQGALFSGTSSTTGSVLAQTDTTTPLNQQVAPNQTIDLFAVDRFKSDATGANYIYAADLNGPTTTDYFIAVNGAVVAQEGTPLPGLATLNVVSLTNTGSGENISPANGHWICRGSFAGATAVLQDDFVLGDGVIRAQVGQPIHAGATELFDDTLYAQCFFNNTVNSNGDYVIGGLTGNPNADRNAVLVLNGLREILREGDGVDLDGDGQADDQLFISIINNDDSFLTDSLEYYFMAELVNGDGINMGQAFLYMNLNARCVGDYNGDGGIDGNDVEAFFIDWEDGQTIADVNEDGGVDGGDVELFFLRWEAGVC